MRAVQRHYENSRLAQDFAKGVGCGGERDAEAVVGVRSTEVDVVLGGVDDQDHDEKEEEQQKHEGGLLRKRESGSTLI